MKSPAFPITDDHIHLDPVNGRGLEAAKDFRRSGGTHIFLVSKPSWSFGIEPSRGADYEGVYSRTLSVAQAVRELGIVVFPVLGVHPAEITRLEERLGLERAQAVMKEGLECAVRHVAEGEAFALKSGRPHYPVEERVMAASNEVLLHALALAREAGCAIQLHAESGPCVDVLELAARAGMPASRVVKHFASPETPLVPSLIARHEAIPALAAQGRRFMLESDYMDELSRPGAVMGPKSVPRATLQLLSAGLIGEEEIMRIHVETPSRVYGVEIRL